MPDQSVTLRVPAGEVATLRDLALEGYSGLARTEGDYDGDDLRSHRETMGEVRAMLDALDTASSGTDCKVFIRDGYIRGLLAHFADWSTGVLEWSPTPPEPSERQKALRRMSCAVRLFAALEEV